MKFVLIYWILTNVGIVTSNLEFNEQKSCETALDQIVKDWAALNPAGRPYGQAGGHCFEKGMEPLPVTPAPVMPTP